jgi:hypothetical protein
MAESHEERVVLQIRHLIQAQDEDIQTQKKLEEQGVDMDGASPSTARFDQEVTQVREWAMSYKSNYSKIFSTDDAVRMLPALLRLGEHIRNSPIIKVGFLGDLVAGHHGGVRLNHLITFDIHLLKTL